MGYQNAQPTLRDALALAEVQHGVVTRRQLLELGLHPQAIKHRVANGRLHGVHHGVYALGRPQLSTHGRWMAAVLSCGPGAVLSHLSAAALLGIHRGERRWIEISVPVPAQPRRAGIVVHRRASLTPAEVTRWHGIPVTSAVCTLIDLAARLPDDQVEAAVNRADKHGLTNPDALRSALDQLDPRPGVGTLRRILDRHTFSLTDSQLERRFLRLARAAGLAQPETGVRLNGFKVDFYWPDLGLVVETDGLRYHRTPAQQARDRRRDQAHATAGLTPLRFTYAQVSFEQDDVGSTLTAVARRLRA